MSQNHKKNHKTSWQNTVYIPDYMLYEHSVLYTFFKESLKCMY